MKGPLRRLALTISDVVVMFMRLVSVLTVVVFALGLLK